MSEPNVTQRDEDARRRTLTSRQPVDVAEVARALGADGMQDLHYRRRSTAMRKAGCWNRMDDRYLAVQDFAELIEQETGRHVTPLFYRLLHQAVRRGLKRPNGADLQRAAREVLPLIEARARAKVIDLAAYRKRRAAAAG